MAILRHLSCATFTVLLLPGAVLAEGRLSSLDDRFSLEAGYFLTNWNTDLEVNGDEVNNQPIDLEESLGFDEDDETFLAGLTWRFADRHQVIAGYWEFRRTATATLDTEIAVGDERFPVGARVTSEWDIYIAPISYNYSIHQSDSLELVLSAGVHWTGIEFAIGGDIFAGEESLGLDGRVKATTDAPLPLLGAGLTYALTDRWELGLRAAWFGFDVDLSGGELEGDIYSADAGLVYRFSQHFSAGLKYTFFEIDVAAGSDNWDGGIDFSYQGPQLYLGAHF